MMIGSSEHSTKGDSGVLRAKARSAALEGVLALGRMFCCAAVLGVLSFCTARTAEITYYNGGEALSPRWVLNLASLSGDVLMFLAIAILIGVRLCRHGEGVLASLSLLSSIRNVGRRASLSRDGSFVHACNAGSMWGVPVALAVKVTQGASVIVIGPKGDLITLEERMWTSPESHAWRQRVEELLWNGGTVDDLVTTIVPEAWFASRDQLRLARQHIFYAVRIMRGRGFRLGLEGFVRMLDPDVLSQTAEYLEQSQLRLAVETYRDSLTAKDKASLAAAVERLRVLV